MSRIEFTEDMNEVTGLGGFYERCCRAAIVAGASWCIEHTDQPFDAEMLQRLIFDTLFVARDDGVRMRLGDELTTTQMAIIMYHLRYIAANGWNKYRECMSVPVKVYAE